MSTDEQPYPPDRLLFMARTHHKVIDYYNYVLEVLSRLTQNVRASLRIFIAKKKPWRR